MKRYFEREAQCQSDEETDIVLERGTDGEVHELTIPDEEAENDAGNNPEKQ